MTVTELQRTIILVEDEPALRDNYRLALEKAGYKVQDYATADAAVAAVEQRMPDLAILDIGLGNDSEAGFSLCQSLRRLSARLPILFLTARDSELDIISGLRLGADDYLTKDISLAQLITRVNTLLRRVDVLSANEAVALLEVGPLSIDQERLQALWRGQPVALTVTEFWLVSSLAINPGQVKSRQQLMDAANVVLDDQTITAHVKRIRKKFHQVDTDFNCIQTVYGLGYRWVEGLDY